MLVNKKTTWTPHHTHRNLHAFVLVVSVVVVVSVAWALGIVLASVQASNVASPEQLIQSNKTQLQSATSTIAAPAVSGTTPAVTVIPGEAMQQRIETTDGVAWPLFVFRTQTPKFIGNTNIPNSTVAVDVSGATGLRGKAQTNADGQWFWQSPVPLALGEHKLLVTATGDRGTITAKDSLTFEIAMGDAKPATIPSDLVQQKQPNNGGTLFDVLVSISQQYRTVTAGDELVANIKLINFGSAGNAVDVPILYTIRNAASEVVLQTSETVAVATQLAFLKSFYTDSSMPAGPYTITIAVPSKNVIATASDSFELRSSGAQAVETNATPPVVKVSFAEGLVNTLKNHSSSIIIVLLLFVLMVSAIIGYIAYSKIAMLTAAIREATRQRPSVKK